MRTTLRCQQSVEAGRGARFGTGEDVVPKGPRNGRRDRFYPRFKRDNIQEGLVLLRDLRLPCRAEGDRAPHWPMSATLSFTPHCWSTCTRLSHVCALVARHRERSGPLQGILRFDVYTAESHSFDDPENRRDDDDSIQTPDSRSAVGLVDGLAMRVPIKHEYNKVLDREEKVMELGE